MCCIYSVCDKMLTGREEAGHLACWHLIHSFVLALCSLLAFSEASATGVISMWAENAWENICWWMYRAVHSSWHSYSSLCLAFDVVSNATKLCGLQQLSPPIRAFKGLRSFYTKGLDNDTVMKRAKFIGTYIFVRVDKQVRLTITRTPFCLQSGNQIFIGDGGLGILTSCWISLFPTTNLRFLSPASWIEGPLLSGLQSLCSLPSDQGLDLSSPSKTNLNPQKYIVMANTRNKFK
jgi:hypothetical protein